MKWYRSKALPLMAVITVAIGLTVYGLSSRIQSKMETAATENVREIVRIIESGIMELRDNDVDTAELIAGIFPAEGDMEALLGQLQINSPFARLSFVPVGAETGISSNGNAFLPADLPEQEREEDSLFSGVYLSDLGAWTYTIQCPVYDGGALTGTLYADVLIERYESVLPNAIYQGKGLAYILQSDTFRFIYEPTSSNVFYSSKYDLHGFFNDFGILDEALEKDINEAITTRNSIIARMWVDGESSYVYFWPIGQGEWYLCGIIPESSIQGEGKAVTQTIATTSILIFGAAAITFALYAWYSGKSRRARQYQIALFNSIAKSIDDVVLLYDCKTGNLEVAFDNMKRILGLDDVQLNELCAQTGGGTARGGGRLLQILTPETFQARNEISEKLEWNNPKTGLRQYLEVETSYVTLAKSEKCILSILDITNEEQMQESLRASALAAQNASRVKSDFLSQMSHEIRTPMNAVVGMAQIAEAKLDDRARIKDCLQKIRSSSQHLLSLINDILDISKIESQKMSLSESWFDLEAFLSDLGDVISVQASLRKQRFTIQNRAGNVGLFADQTRLNQVLMNLLSNSVKYTPEGGCITFSIEMGPAKARDYRRVSFLVRDNGIGMSDEFQQKLFMPFEREDDPAVHTQTGTGLGLAIVESIVSLMGGSIRVESAKGVGTTFYVDIDFRYQSTEQLEEVSAPEQEICDLTGIVILLAEDNEINREIAKEFLEMVHAQVECAVDGADAVEKFRSAEEDHFHLILMDMQMPRLDGLGATRQIRSLDRADAKAVPIIAVTANAFFEDEQKCLDAGMNDHVAKPLEMQMLYQKLKKYLSFNVGGGEKHEQEQ